MAGQMAGGGHDHPQEVGATVDLRQQRHLDSGKVICWLNEGLLLTIVSVSLVVLLVGICFLDKWLRRHPGGLDRWLPHRCRSARNRRVQHDRDADEFSAIHRNGVGLGDLEAAGLGGANKTLATTGRSGLTGGSLSMASTQLQVDRYTVGNTCYDEEMSFVLPQKVKKALAEPQANLRSAAGGIGGMIDVDLDEYATTVESFGSDATAVDVNQEGMGSSYSDVLPASSPPQTAVVDNLDGGIDGPPNATLGGVERSTAPSEIVSTSIERYEPGSCVLMTSPLVVKKLKILSCMNEQRSTTVKTSPIVQADPHRQRRRALCDKQGNRNENGSCCGDIVDVVGGLAADGLEERSLPGAGAGCPSAAGVEAGVISAPEVPSIIASETGVIRDVETSGEYPPMGSSLSSLSRILGKDDGGAPSPAVLPELDDMCYSPDDDFSHEFITAVAAPQSSSRDPEASAKHSSTGSPLSSLSRILGKDDGDAPSPAAIPGLDDDMCYSPDDDFSHEFITAAAASQSSVRDSEASPEHSPTGSPLSSLSRMLERDHGGAPSPPVIPGLDDMCYSPDDDVSHEFITAAAASQSSIRDSEASAKHSPTGSPLSSLSRILGKDDDDAPSPPVIPGLDDDMCYSPDDDFSHEFITAVVAPQRCSSPVLTSQPPSKEDTMDSSAAMAAATEAHEPAAAPPLQFSKEVNPEFDDDGGLCYSPSPTESVRTGDGLSFSDSSSGVRTVEEDAASVRKVAGDISPAASVFGSCADSSAGPPEGVGWPTGTEQQIDLDDDDMCYSSASTDPGIEEQNDHLVFALSPSSSSTVDSDGSDHFSSVSEDSLHGTESPQLLGESVARSPAAAKVRPATLPAVIART